MSAIDDGGPAFPVLEQRCGNGELIQHFAPGMTLRAYIATHRPAPNDINVSQGRAFAGEDEPSRSAFADSPDGIQEWKLAMQMWWAKVEAAYSVMKADALIAALNAVTP